MGSNADFDEKVLRCIPSEFNMIAAADDSEEAQEALNAAEFELPNPNGKEGGVCTSALLQVFYDNAHKLDKLNWIQVLKQMRCEMKSMGFVQEPQFTSSRPIEVTKPVTLVPKGSGRRRALLIGINYVGQKGELKAPWNDLENIKDYLENVLGFSENQILILMDDGQHPSPTKANIEAAFQCLVRYSQPGDVNFISFSGHGGRTRDLDGDEDDGWDESIMPVDFQTAGQIVDDDILKDLIKPMAEGVHTTLLMDCCHSGTVADLPYKIGADDSQMEIEDGFNTKTVDELRREKANKGGASGGGNRKPGDAPSKDYHESSLPYNPEDGFKVRKKRPEPEKPKKKSWLPWKKDKDKKK